VPVRARGSRRAAGFSSAAPSRGGRHRWS